MIFTATIRDDSDDVRVIDSVDRIWPVGLCSLSTYLRSRCFLIEASDLFRIPNSGSAPGGAAVGAGAITAFWPYLSLWCCTVGVVCLLLFCTGAAPRFMLQGLYYLKLLSGASCWSVQGLKLRTCFKLNLYVFQVETVQSEWVGRVAWGGPHRCLNSSFSAVKARERAK